MHISVIIPTHNRAGLLARALASVFSQTFAPVEVIVVGTSTGGLTAAKPRFYGGALYGVPAGTSGVLF